MTTKTENTRDDETGALLIVCTLCDLHKRTLSRPTHLQERTRSQRLNLRAVVCLAARPSAA